MKADDGKPRTSSSESFLSRWSRRKAAIAESDANGKSAAPLPINDTTAGMASDATAYASADSKNVKLNTSNGAAFEAKMLQNDHLEPTLPTAKSGNADFSEPLPSIEHLTGESDFSPFMKADVTPALRNQAMKKLFTDPHYNIMDGLDIYIDDYGKPDPIPPAMLRMMHQAKSLGLFDNENDNENINDETTEPTVVTASQTPAITGDDVPGATNRSKPPSAGEPSDKLFVIGQDENNLHPKK